MELLDMNFFKSLDFKSTKATSFFLPKEYKCDIIQPRCAKNNAHLGCIYFGCIFSKRIFQRFCNYINQKSTQILNYFYLTRIYKAIT